MTNSLMQFGKYTLGQPIEQCTGVRKFSWMDRLLRQGKIPGETLYHTKERIDFLNSTWGLVLGVSQGQIYKLSVGWGGKTKAAMDDMLYRCVSHCQNELGTERKGNKENAAFWETDFGIVTINARSAVHRNSEYGIFLIILESTAHLKLNGASPFVKN